MMSLAWSGFVIRDRGIAAAKLAPRRCLEQRQPLSRSTGTNSIALGKWQGGGGVDDGEGVHSCFSANESRNDVDHERGQCLTE